MTNKHQKIKKINLKQSVSTKRNFHVVFLALSFGKHWGFTTLSASGVLTKPLNQVFIYNGNFETIFCILLDSFNS